MGIETTTYLESRQPFRMIVQVVNIDYIVLISSREDCRWEIFVFRERSDSGADDHVGTRFPIWYSRLWKRIKCME